MNSDHHDLFFSVLLSDDQERPKQQMRSCCIDVKNFVMYVVYYAKENNLPP